MSSRLASKRRVAACYAGWALWLPAVLAPVHAAPGPKADAVAAHHVRLTGQGEDNAARVRALVDAHGACAQLRKLEGRPSVALPAELPPVVQAYDVDIYYGAERTVSIVNGKVYEIAQDGDCKLAPRETRHKYLTWPGGSCDIDLLANTARGFCPPNAAPVPMGDGTGTAAARKATDTGKTRVVAGIACRVHGSPGFETCLAQAEQVPGTKLDPWPVQASWFGKVGGIVLDAQTRVMTLTAQQVEWNQHVAADVFELPGGLRVNPGAKK